ASDTPHLGIHECAQPRNRREPSNRISISVSRPRYSYRSLAGFIGEYRPWWFRRVIEHEDGDRFDDSPSLAPHRTLIPPSISTSSVMSTQLSPAFNLTWTWGIHITFRNTPARHRRPAAGPAYESFPRTHGSSRHRHGS